MRTFTIWKKPAPFLSLPPFLPLKYDAPLCKILRYQLRVEILLSVSICEQQCAFFALELLPLGCGVWCCPGRLCGLQMVPSRTRAAPWLPPSTSGCGWPQPPNRMVSPGPHTTSLLVSCLPVQWLGRTFPVTCHSHLHLPSRPTSKVTSSRKPWATLSAPYTHTVNS